MPVGLNDTLLDIGSAAMQSAATHAGLFTAAPNSTGTTNVSAAARQSLTWVTAANGDMIVTVDAVFSGCAASGPITHLGLWSASTAGTFYGYFALTGDQTANAAGAYTVTDIVITGTAT